MTRRKNVEREQHWRGVIRDQQASGLSISAFCREREVSPASFFTWRRRLTQRDQKDMAAKFVPLQMHAPPTATPARCEVVLPDGCRIIVPTQCDANWLRDVLAVLTDRPC
jgi:transposase-like protein